jgi:hypothetical protein
VPEISAHSRGKDSTSNVSQDYARKRLLLHTIRRLAKILTDTWGIKIGQDKIV